MGRGLSLTLWGESILWLNGERSVSDSMGRVNSMAQWEGVSMGRGLSLTLWGELSRAYMGSKLIVITNSASFISLVTKHNKQFDQLNCSTNHVLGLRVLTNQITDQSCAGIEGFDQSNH